VVSLWELVVKCGTGALRIASPGRTLPDWTARLGARILPFEAVHAFAVHDLPPIHGDPFDRLLVAQAMVEDLPLLSSDECVRQYPVRCVW